MTEDAFRPPSKGVDAVTIANETLSKSSESSLPDLIPLLESVAEAASILRDRARDAVAGKVMASGKIHGDALEREQHAAHGLAWIATYAEALNQVASYARRMADEGRFGEMEALLAQVGAAEYASQLSGGVPMSQGEIARLHELGVSEKDQTAFLTANVRDLIAGATPATRARAIELIRGSQGAVSYGDTGLDETITAMREEMHRFSEAEVVPNAQEW
ncbi:MAG TPA: acyl-CoA dehydrogenase, partial [Methyloceanibacter sp.]|nr:acyl-CoA dehydrogenase [Methyloceanibacter sp.]